jgi:hypothetical protein
MCVFSVICSLLFAAGRECCRRRVELDSSVYLLHRGSERFDLLLLLRDLCLKKLLLLVRDRLILSQQLVACCSESSDAL